jgi:hypothetical protein
LHAEVEASESTALGGLALAARVLALLKAPQAIDSALSLLRSHRPFHESDHVLTHVYNLFVGGTAIEDIADLQHSEPVKRMLGTSRIPDPTTAGDFLRRFDEDALKYLDGAIDEVQERAWKRRYGGRKRKQGVVDLDSHVRHVYGNQKEGADFTYKGGFGYHPLVISMAGSQECLRLVNRSGNAPSADGAAEHLGELVPLLKSRFRNVLVRGDSAFARQDTRPFAREAGPIPIGSWSAPFATGVECARKSWPTSVGWTPKARNVLQLSPSTSSARGRISPSSSRIRANCPSPR